MSTLTRGLAMSVLPSVMRAHPLAVFAALDRAPPLLLAEVPIDRRRQAGFESPGGVESELLRNLAGVDGIAPVMTGTILHERDEVPRVRRGLGEAGAQAGVRCQAVPQDVTQSAHQVEIGDLVLASDVVGFAGPAAF